MNTIEKYIRFAIENNLKIWTAQINETECDVKLDEKLFIITGLLWSELYRCNLYELITSKEFIDAVARWTKSREVYTKIYWIEVSLIDQITIFQSFAIRDWKLETFIKNLIT